MRSESSHRDAEEVERRAAERLEARRLAALHPTSLDRAIAWARAESLTPQPFVGACCGLALAGTGGGRHGLAQQGLGPPAQAPEQADLLLVMGTIGLRQAEPLRAIYERMPEPRRVVAVGACACSGGPYTGYATVGGVDSLIPVDIFIPGCPPSPEAVLDGLLELKALVRSDVRSRSA